MMSYLERLWDAGERHLAAGRYVAARRELEAAEGLAWRKRDAATLARVYLPLLEARRQIRLNAVEGVIVVGAAGHAGLEAFLRRGAGTILWAGHDAGSIASGCKAAGSVRYASSRAGSCLEALLVLEHHGEVRVASPVDATLAGGLAGVKLPGAGVWDPAKAEMRAGHAAAREALLLAWEALALHWQARHPLHVKGPSVQAAWEEMAWLRLALRVDGACEPVAMRVMALAEAVERG